ncbi:zinc knuckle CX2CX4HX4C containing protein [Tanacetum coccineum]
MNETVDCGGETDIVSNNENADCGGIRNEGEDIDEDVLVTEVEGKDIGNDSAKSMSRNVNEELKENDASDSVGMKKKDSDSYEENGVINGNSSNKTKVLEDEFEQMKSQSYADVIGKNKVGLGEFDKSLMDIPTELDSNGVEIVVFDEVMIAEGCKKWDKTLFAYFVGNGMAVSELKYNLRKMWSRYGFKDIVDYSNGVYFMKFNNENGLESVVNNGP